VRFDPESNELGASATANCGKKGRNGVKLSIGTASSSTATSRLTADWFWNYISCMSEELTNWLCTAPKRFSNQLSEPLLSPEMTFETYSKGMTRQYVETPIA
jgi:hypothetical protein